MSKLRLSKVFMKIGRIYMWNGFYLKKPLLEGIYRIFWIFIYFLFSGRNQENSMRQRRKNINLTIDTKC